MATRPDNADAPRRGGNAAVDGETHPLTRVEAVPPPPGGLDASERLCLWVFSAGGNAVYDLPTRGVVTLGRASDNTITLTDPSISRRHAVLELGPPLRVRDAGSANGVFVGRRRLEPESAVVLAPGQLFELGAVPLVVQPASTPLRAAAPAAATPQSVAPAPPAPASSVPRPAAPSPRPPDTIVEDPVMRRIYDLVARIGGSPIGVLLLGETGVGKEVVAEAVHRSSNRAAGPLVRLNCGALSAELLESELFGHEKGAFTGALATKPGLLETADGGTVFLDEVGELPPALQVKLLRALEERQVRRVGALAARPVDLRFVAATNRDLGAEVAAGRFRQDLYFRLNGISIVIPPLRERVAEIAPLARAFAARERRALGLAGEPTFAPEALAWLERHGWPGNVRELRHAIQRAVLLSGGGVITAAHLAGDPRAPSLAPPPPPDASPEARRAALERELAELERARIVDALEKCAGNQTRAAELLGMPRRTLVAKLGEYNVPRPRKPRAP